MKLLVLSNFFFCHYVFKKPSAAEASESVYMRERVKLDTNKASNCDVMFMASSQISSLKRYINELISIVKMVCKIPRWTAE